MNNLQNERGNASLYLLWLLGIVAIIFVLTINLVKVYVVKEHANLAVEQAALAGTSVLLEKTKKAVSEFDNSTTINPLYVSDVALQRLTDHGKSVENLIDEKKAELMDGGMDEADAYIKAANNILPVRVDRHPYLKMKLRESLGHSSTDAYYIFASTVQEIISQNGARTEDTEMKFSNDDWRIEVKSTVRFETISDNRYISKFIEDIPQKGYGPTLTYLENVYTGSVIFPTP